MLPSSEPAKRLHALFNRRKDTHWTPKEVSRFRLLVKQKAFESLDDLELIEAYYAFERKKGDNGCHRRDLQTLINNWQPELDRARAWRERHPLKREPRKIIEMPLPKGDEPILLPQTPEEVEQLRRFEEERLARKARRS